MLNVDTGYRTYPVKNVARIVSCLFDGSLVENNIKSDGSTIIFLAHNLEIPWLELAQNPSHAWVWKTNKTWINDKEKSWNLVSIWTKLPSIRVMKWHGISMRNENLCHIFLQGSLKWTNKELFSHLSLLIIKTTNPALFMTKNVLLHNKMNGIIYYVIRI